MSDKEKPNRRDFIFTATAAVGAVGAGAAAWPLICLLYTSDAADE